MSAKAASFAERDETNALVGMVLFLAAWAMMFAALFASYGFMRARAPVWPPAGLPRLPLLLPAINTAVLALSSAFVELGRRSGRRALVSLGAVTGAGFLGLQTLLWAQLSGLGVDPSNAGTYGSVLYGFTWVHAAHVAVGVVGLVAAVAMNARRGMRLWSWYWHFVGAVWLAMFAALFVA